MGHDGWTLWERVVGKRAGTAVAEFGDMVMFLKKGPNRERQCSFGIWLGLVTRTQETYLGTPDGVVHAWAIRTVGEHERWRS